MTINNKLAKLLGIGAAVLAVSATSAFALDASATRSVNVRSGPGTGYHVVDRLYRGEHVNITRHSDGWCYVRKSGPDGWVSCSYLRAEDIFIPRHYPHDGLDDFDHGPIIQFHFGFGDGMIGPYDGLPLHDGAPRDGHWDRLR